MTATIGTSESPAWKLLMALVDRDPGVVKMLLDEHEKEALSFAYQIATLAAALWEAPCSHCANPGAHQPS